MGWRPLAVAVAGLAVAIAAEAATYLPEEPALAAGDALVGLAFISLGLVAWQRRPSSRSGLLVAAGDNPQRLHSDAAFSALCGISPVEVSSGHDGTASAEPGW